MTGYKKNYDDILESLKRKLSFSPDNQYMLISIARLYFVICDYARAIVYFKKALDISEDYNLYYSLAECYEFNDDFDNAAGNYEKCIEFNEIDNDNIVIKIDAYRRLLEIYKLKKNEAEVIRVSKELGEINQLYGITEINRSKFIVN